jgi:hypothetical protein
LIVSYQQDWLLACVIAAVLVKKLTITFAKTEARNLVFEGSAKKIGETSWAGQV